MRTKLTEKFIKTLEPKDKRYSVWDIEQPGLFLRVNPKGSITFFLFYRVDGRANDYALGRWGKITLAQARELARQKSGEVATGQDVQAVKKAAKAETARAKQDQEKARQQTLRVFLTEVYEPWVKQNRRGAVDTLYRIRRGAADWMDMPMSDINPWIVEKWRSQKLKAGAKPATLNRYLAALKAALAKAVEWAIIDMHPLAKVKPAKLDSRGTVRYLSDAEERRLRKALSDRETRIRTGRASGNQWRAERGHDLLPDLSSVAFVDHLQPIVLLAANTGLRRGELFNLRWSDINLRTRILTVQGSGSKSGETRHVPLNDEALDVLTRWRRQAENTAEDNGDISACYVFPASDGGRLDNIKKAFGKLLVDAEIERFRFHDLRHDFASKLVMRGCDLNTVRELLGHADLKMTLRYSHLAPEHKAAAVALLNKGVA